jgi:predicted nucleic acid-binding protein
VIDASIGVKWFSRKDEADLAKADLLLDSQKDGSLTLYTPDLFYYEVANVLAHKADLSDTEIEVSVESLWDLGLILTPVDRLLLFHSVALARRGTITVYDACYVVVATSLRLPLVTANPRHQGKMLGCQVIPLKEWSGL